MDRRFVQGFALATAIMTAVPVLTAAQTQVNPPLMKVNGETIFAAEVSLVLRDLVAQMRQLGQNPPQEKMVEAATQKVVERKLLAQEARRRNLKPNAARVEQHLAQVLERAGGRDKLEAFLAAGGASFATVETMVREADLVEVLLEVEVEPKVTVTEEQIAEYYRTNPEAFRAPEMMRAQHVLVAVPENADQAARDAARAKAAEARRRAVAGEDFAALAKELSDCPSAEQGGDLGLFSREQMVDPFGETAFALAPGAISKVIETSFGFHVIKAGERRAPVTRTLDEVHDRLQEMMFQRAVAEEMGQMVETLHAAAEVVSLVDGTPAAGPNPTSNGG